jgi:hypothetical protein
MSLTIPLVGGTVPHSTELVDFSAAGRDVEAQLPPEPKPNRSFCASLFNDYMEIAPCTLAVSSIALVVLFGLYGLGCYYIDNPDYWRWGGVGAGAVAVAAFIVVGLVSCGSCLTIRHLKPEKDLEGQINKLGQTVRDYTEQIHALQQVNAHLRQLAIDFEVIAKHQIELKQQTEQMLQTKVGELQTVNEALGRTQQELENSEHVLHQLQEQIIEANKINDQISATLLAAQQHVPDIARVSDGAHDHEGAVVVNIGELSDANLSFNQHNTNLTQLTDELKKQLVFMTKFQDTLSQHAAIFSAGAMDLNETDDKLLAAAQSLGGTAVQREKLLRQMSDKLKKTQDVLKTLKQALEQIEDPQLKAEFTPIVRAIDELD